MEVGHLTTQDVVEEGNTQAIELWRTERYDDACQVLRDLLASSPNLDGDALLRTRNNLAMCERGRGNYEEARRIHLESSALAEATTDLKLCGKFHHGLAVSLQYLGELDLAMLEFTAALVWYERAGEEHLREDVENNIAVLLLQADHVDDAVAHLVRALCIRPEPALLAQVEETLSQYCLAKGETAHALAAAAKSVTRLLELNEPRLLTKSASTLGRALAAWEHERETERIIAVLEECEWNITHAAQQLGMGSRQALQNHLRRHFPAINDERIRRNNIIASQE
jgi:tetratricopeptide (TPR) repeat protein